MAPVDEIVRREVGGADIDVGIAQRLGLVAQPGIEPLSSGQTSLSRTKGSQP